MSAGTRVFSVRLPVVLVDLALETARVRGRGQSGQCWSLSDFIRIAMAEKVAKMGRSRKRDVAAGCKAKLREFLKRIVVDPEAVIESTEATLVEIDLKVEYSHDEDRAGGHRKG
jgi:hypothetical protein